MKLTTDWREPAPGVVLITPGGMGAARLFGLLFAMPGGYLLYQFLDGVLHPGELTIAGWVMLPLFAAVFLVPGWIIVFGSKRTRLDTTRREATEEYAFLVYTRRKTTRIPRDAHVMLRYEQGSTRQVRGPVTTSAVTGYQLCVYLDPAAPAPGGRSRAELILLSIFGSNEKDAALAFAHKVAALVGIDVQDRCFEGGEIGAGGVVVDHLGSEDAD
jgi:hypothetical protein